MSSGRRLTASSPEIRELGEHVRQLTIELRATERAIESLLEDVDDVHDQIEHLGARCGGPAALARHVDLQAMNDAVPSCMREVLARTDRRFGEDLALVGPVKSASSRLAPIRRATAIAFGEFEASSQNQVLRRRVIALVACLFVAVTILRIFSPASDATTLLYVFPVALLGAKLGKRAGLVGALVAFSLFACFAAAHLNGSVGPSGWIARASVLLLVAGLSSAEGIMARRVAPHGAFREG